MDQNQKSRITRIQLALENHEWIKAFHLAEASILTNPEILPFRYLMIDALIQGGRFDEAMKRVTDWPEGLWQRVDRRQPSSFYTRKSFGNSINTEPRHIDIF